MFATVTAADVAWYTARQLNALFPTRRDIGEADLLPAAVETLERIERCFGRIALPLYRHGEDCRFDLYHSDHYCTYLAYLGNTLWRHEADPTLLGRVFSLNKALHGLNCMYDNIMPETILLVHVVGTVLGKAALPDYLAVMQGVTIGALGGVYPTLSPGLVLSAGASIIGPGSVGANVMLEPFVHVTKPAIPSDVRVAGEPPHRFVPHTDRGLRFFFRLPPQADSGTTS